MPTSPSRALPALILVTLAACAPGASEPGQDAPEPTEDRYDGVGPGTVAQAVKASCTTSAVEGLSKQIIAEAACVDPDAFVPLPSRANLDAGSNVFLYLEKPARDRLVAALDANPGKTMTVNSMLRTVAQQYLLHRWGQQGRCGIGLAAYPGASNHESGLALDIEEWSTWRAPLKQRGFAWFGYADEVHFDYAGPGAKDHRGLDVLAFQRLHNRNNPSDKIAEDGDFGPATEARLKKAPAKGFAKGASCQGGGAPTCDAVFVDICGSSHRADIEWIASQGLTEGCDPAKKLYCPDRDLSREQLAGFLAVALGLPAGPDAFTDDESSPFEAAIDAVAAAGIATGCGGGSFCPKAAVTRGELAEMFAKGFALPPGPDAFTDDEGSPYEASIDALAAAGITGGCAPGKFCPDDRVTRAQLASFLRRALE